MQVRGALPFASYLVTDTHTPKILPKLWVDCFLSACIIFSLAWLTGIVVRRCLLGRQAAGGSDLMMHEQNHMVGCRPKNIIVALHGWYKSVAVTLCKNGIPRHFACFEGLTMTAIISTSSCASRFRRADIAMLSTSWTRTVLRNLDAHHRQILLYLFQSSHQQRLHFPYCMNAYNMETTFIQ